jgi:hypothetical protein
MRVNFERGGGFAPAAMRLSHTVDSDELSTDEANELDDLIRSANLGNLSQSSSDVRARPDAFYYQLTIKDDDGDKTIKASDVDMPSSLRPLVDWLTKRAMQNR